jgi:hypothetical protein
MFCAGIAYHVLMTFLANGVSSSGGWYLYAVIVPEVVLAAAGLRAIAPRLIGGAALAFGMLDLYGMLFVALPYYTGLLAHRPNGFLEAFHFQRIGAIGWGEVLQRIAVNKPEWIGSTAVAWGGGLYFIATCTLAAMALFSARFFGPDSPAKSRKRR